MNTNRAVIYAIVVNLITLCFSGQALAYQLFNNPQLQNDYNIDTIYQRDQKMAKYL